MTDAKARTTIEAWEDELRTAGAVHLGVSSSKTALHLVLGVFFTIAGILIILDGTVAVVGWFSVVVFGLLIPVMLWRLMTGRPSLTVTESHVTISGSVHVAWCDVLAIVVFPARFGAQMILLRMRSEALQREAIRGSRWQARFIDSSNAMTKGPDLAIPRELEADQTSLTLWLVAVHNRATARNQHPC